MYHVYTKGNTVDAKEIVKILKQNGFTKQSQKGSHAKYINGVKITIIPIHGSKDVPVGTVKSIEKQSGLKIL